MLKRSPGPLVRGTIGLPERSFLVDFVTEYSFPSRKIEQKGGFVLWKEEGTLNGTFPEFRGLDSSHLAQVAILVQTISGEFQLDAVVFIHWLRVVLQLLAGNCLPYINLIVLQPTNLRKCWSLPGFFSRFEGGDFACMLSGGPTTDHPYLLPALPEASDADAVVRRCPAQGMQTNSEHSTIFAVRPHAWKVSGREGPLVA